jgi:exodeoxyribonuclease V alpha subunit
MRTPPPSRSSTPPAKPGKLEGLVERIAFCNDENAWSVIKLSVSGRVGEVTAVGNLLGVQPGESLRLFGTWTTDRKYGEQFKVDSYVAVMPATLVGIRRYLGSGIVPGIGKVIAERLVKHFGLETLEVIDKQPDRLRVIDGIGPVRGARITKAWAKQRQVGEVMVFLQSHGISPAHATRIYKEYKDRAIAIVKDNPYQLAIDIAGIGFKSADRIAGNLGIPPTSPRRAEAGILHVLGEMAGDGHVFSPHDVLVTSASEILAIDQPVIKQAIADLCAKGHVVVVPMGDGRTGVYLKALHVAEAGSAARIRLLLASPPRSFPIDIELAIAWFQEQRDGITLADEQKEAIRKAVTSKILIITGGPGTGKTTVVNGIIRILERKNQQILLAAPTGRAAKRMAETTGREARTIHRLLEFSPKTMSFERHADRPLDADVLVLDEASMIDIVLAHNVLKAVPRHCRLILVGDTDQLPSVGPGSVLKDLIAAGVAEVVRLRHIFRQADRSLIVANAHRVNNGQLPDTPTGAADPDFFFIERGEPSEVAATIRALVSERIPRRFHLDPIDDIQVLAPMHRGGLGVAALNVGLQALLNPSGESITRRAQTFRVGDKVMQTRNNYDLDVFNGDIGRVVRVNSTDQEVVIDYGGRRVTYDSTDLDDIVLAYACSIHKSQGSEYPCVVIPLHTQHYVMLQRNLLYTGITRGRRLVVLVGSRRALAIAVNNDKIEARNTLLSEWLRKGRPER